MHAIQPRIPEIQEGKSNGKQKFPVEIFGNLDITSKVVLFSGNCEKCCSASGHLDELKAPKDNIFISPVILVCRFCQHHKLYPPTCKIALLVLKVSQQQELSSFYCMHATFNSHTAV